MDRKFDALCPVYQDNYGDIVHIILDNGEIKRTNRKIGTIFKLMAQNQMQDIQLIRTNVQKLLQRKRNIPVVLGPDDIYIPIKTRKPLTKRDPCYSYIRMKAIKSYGFHTIQLKSKRRISTLYNKKQTEEAIIRGRCAKVLMDYRQEIFNQMENVILK
ncbi:MAG: hypothetical protein Q4P28_05105 [Tissierellia bacterium]|nr:hypothetical protein [Tissierellia bacterium]